MRPNFIECNTVEEANAVDLLEYRALGIRRSKGVDVYAFQRRAKKLGED